MLPSPNRAAKNLLLPVAPVRKQINNRAKRERLRQTPALKRNVAYREVQPNGKLFFVFFPSDILGDVFKMNLSPIWQGGDQVITDL